MFSISQWEGGESVLVTGKKVVVTLEFQLPPEMLATANIEAVFQSAVSVRGDALGLVRSVKCEVKSDDLRN